MNERKTGRVSAVQKGSFRILQGGEELRATLSGAFYHDGREFPVVGDYVEYDYIPAGDSRIQTVLPRRTVLRRPDQSGHAIGFVKTMQEQTMAANFDYVFIVTSLNGDYSYNRVARYASVTLQGGGIPVAVLTKSDLTDPAPYVAELSTLSEKLQVHAVSSYTGQGLDALRAYLREGVTIALLGSSGAGKSTLVNTLAGHELMAAGAIREKDSKGRHTTTYRQLLPFPGGVTLIDTPGMRELGVCDTDEGIDGAFSDVRALIDACRYRDCQHREEPGCAVRAALESGVLPRERWALYLSLTTESRKNALMKSIAVQRKRIAANNRKR